MRIRKFKAEDLPYIHELQPPDWPDVTPHFAYYLSSKNCIPLCGVADGKIVAVGTLIHHGDTAWLAHIIVHISCRNAGYGKMITSALIDKVDDARCRTVYLMATPLGEPVYRRLGFVNENRQLFFKGVSVNHDFTVHPGVRTYDARYQRALLELDRQVSGENRSARISEHLNKALIFLHDNTLTGYYIPGLGEGPIVAKDPAAGVFFMKHRLIHMDVAIVPEDNKVAVALLNDEGLEVFRTAQRMRLGEARNWYPECVFNRISGQIG